VSVSERKDEFWGEEAVVPMSIACMASMESSKL